METKGNNDRMSRVARKLSFSSCEIVEAKGVGGGLTLMWIEDIALDCLWVTNKMMCCFVQLVNCNIHWKILGVYGTPYRKENESFWSNFEKIVGHWKEPWLLMGDFNEVLNTGEKFGG